LPVLRNARQSIHFEHLLESNQMIIVLAKVSVKPEKKSALLELARGVMAATQKEEGCISYVLFDHPHDPGRCMFVEEWTSREALAKHAASAHIAEWRKQNADYLSAKTEVNIFQAEKVSP
jgi:quinol monooxygenase YgiN